MTSVRLERSELADGLITCAFCGEHGNWKLEHHAEKKKPNEQKRLNFDTLKCGWSNSKGA